MGIDHCIEDLELEVTNLDENGKIGYDENLEIELHYDSTCTSSYDYFKFYYVDENDETHHLEDWKVENYISSEGRDESEELPYSEGLEAEIPAPRLPGAYELVVVGASGGQDTEEADWTEDFTYGDVDSDDEIQFLGSYINVGFAWCNESNFWCYGTDFDRDGSLDTDDNSTFYSWKGSSNCNVSWLNEANLTNNIANFSFDVYPEVNDANKFIMKDHWDNNISWMGSSGNIILSGGCYNLTDLDLESYEDEDWTISNGSFKIVNPTSNDVVAYFDVYGNLFISEGSCDDSDMQSSCVPEENAFKIKDSANNVVSYIDIDGKLCLKGGLHEFASDEKLNI